MSKRPSPQPPDKITPRPTNADLCASYVLQQIEEGLITSKTRLGEPSLAKEMGVDRASVRAAFERLSATGILERKERSGTYLKRMSFADLRSANQVRCELEMLGARLASVNATKKQVEQLLTTARLLDELTNTYASGEMQVWSSIRSLEIEFHTMIARFSQNPYLLSMMNRDSFLQVCFPFLAVSTTLRQSQVRRFLKDSVNNMDVAQAIQHGDPEFSGNVMRKHVEGSLELYKKAMEERD